MAGTVMILQPGLRHLWVRADVYNPVLDLVGGISGADHVGCIGNGSCQFCEAADWERHDHEPLLDNFSSGTALQHSITHLPLAGSFCLSYKPISLLLLTINICIFQYKGSSDHFLRHIIEDAKQVCVKCNLEVISVFHCVGCQQDARQLLLEFLWKIIEMCWNTILTIN